jgi:hypothetical protein
LRSESVGPQNARHRIGWQEDHDNSVSRLSVRVKRVKSGM